MKIIHWITAVAAFAFVQTTPASAGVNDPEVIIYRFPGVFDSGGGINLGFATVFHCTNFSGATETIRFVTRASNGGLLTNKAFAISHLQTITAVTHDTLIYSFGVQLSRRPCTSVKCFADGSSTWRNAYRDV